MTEPNNTPNDPSNQESLDDVLRGLSSEGSEEEQSLDDILASLSEDASDEETLPAENVDTNDLLSDINDLKSDVFLEPPISSVPEPEPSTFNLNAMPSGLDSILADSEESIDDAVGESIRSAASEQASPFDASIPSPSIDEPRLPADTFASDLTDVVSESTAEPASGWGDELFSAESQIPESLSEMGAEPELPNDSALPEPEELSAFDNADSGAPVADVPPIASPFDPIPSSQPVDDIGEPFTTPADTLESTFAETTESSTEPSSSWGDAASGAESQIPESISDFSAEPESLPEVPLPTPEEATPFNVNADVTPSSPFDTPTTPPQPDVPTSPFSEPPSEVEPAFTSFIGADSSNEPQATEPPLEGVPPEADSDSVDVVDESLMTGQPSAPASEPELFSVPEASLWGNNPNLTPLETPAADPEVPATAFNPPDATIKEPSAPEPIALNDSDPDLATPELPSLPPLAQPTFSGTGESLSQASIDAPQAPAAIRSDSDEPMNLKSLLDRPRHRWLVPFGFILILLVFGAIIFGALRGNQESDPAPETQEQSSSPSLTTDSSS